MEKMNKEQLIEWFIEKYGDHPLLAQFVSKEEIRQRLNENIKEVTYNHEPGDTAGNYNYDNKIINIDFEKAFFKQDKEQCIVHEMLHALTYSYSEEEYEKDGLMVRKKGDFSQEDEETWNSINEAEKGGLWKELGRGLNEGITDWLAEELTGAKHKGYTREKITTKLLFEVIGKESILRKYFDREYVQQIHDGFTFEDFFREEIEAKYQDNEVVGKISETVIKLVTLQDILAILGFFCNGELEKLTEQNKKLYDASHKELIETTNDLIRIALETTNDISVKKEILKIAVESSGMIYPFFPQNEAVENAFREFFASKEISASEKRELIEMMDSEDFIMRYHEYKEVENFLFNNEETSEMSINYRMYLYSKVAGGDGIEQFCMNEGILNKADFSKADMLEDFLKAMKVARFSHGEADSHSNMHLDEVQYQRIGNHYELVVQTDDDSLKYLLEEKRYDVETGESFPYSSNRIAQNGEEDPIYEGSNVNTEKWRRIEGEIKRINKEPNNKYSRIEMIGSDVIMWFNIKDENGKLQSRRENYTIGEDGKLEVAQVGEPKRLTDDRSRLDIQLIEETNKAGVATSQMLQVVETMKAILKMKENQNEKSAEKGEK